MPVRRGDYPEFASLAGSINGMAQSLEDGRARERHLLLSVSHDLRTPLTSIRGFAEAIQDGAIEDNAQAADVIIAESRRLERLVGDLLDLTKLEARQMSIAMRPTDVAEVVTTTAEGFRPAAAKSGLALVLQVAGHDGMPTPTPPRPVAADPDRLAQLLANLLENAMTFARATVTVTRGREPGVRAVRHRGRRRRPGHRSRRSAAGVRTLLPGRPGAEPPDGIGARAGDRGRVGDGHGRYRARRVAGQRRRRVALRGDLAAVAGGGTDPVDGLTAQPWLSGVAASASPVRGRAPCAGQCPRWPA